MRQSRLLRSMSLVMLVCVGSQQARSQSRTLSEDQIKAAVQEGQAKKNLSLDSNGYQHAFGALLGPTLWLPPYVVAYAFTPSEWIKFQAYATAKSLKPTYVPDENALAPVLRVFVTSQAGSTIGEGCYQVTNVVLRDVQKTVSVQPNAFQTADQDYQNVFGAKETCAGAVALFDLVAVDKVRSLDATHEFYVSIATDHGIMDRKLKKGQFSRIE